MDIEKIHKDVYEKVPRFISQAPGRINVIGEHTDYNGGYALPVAISRYVQVALSPRKDPLVRVYSGNFHKFGEFTVRELEPSKEDELWLKYVKGAFWILEDAGIPLYGCDLTILGDIPIGAGLSSSAALTVSLLLAILTYSDISYEKDSLPLYAQKVENRYIGVNCGLMDQIVSVFGKKNRALFIDFKDLKFSHIPFELGENILVVFDTRTKRSLANSFYNKRRKECEDALSLLNRCLGKNYRYLGEVSKEELLSCKEILPDPLDKRATHVILENERVLEAVELLKKGDIERLGGLLCAAHKSLSELYEVTSFELDTAFSLARKFGVVGARMTGAGFGGCTINILPGEREKEFASYMEREYLQITGIKPSVYRVEVADGASIL